MGHVTTYMFLLFGVSFALYLGGYQSAFNMLLTQTGSNVTESEAIISQIQSLMILAAGAGVVTGLISGGSSLGRSVALITFFGTFLVAFMFMPLSYIFEASLPFELRIFVTGAMFILLILCSIELMAERTL